MHDVPVLPILMPLFSTLLLRLHSAILTNGSLIGWHGIETILHLSFTPSTLPMETSAMKTGHTRMNPRRMAAGKRTRILSFSYDVVETIGHLGREV